MGGTKLFQKRSAGQMVQYLNWRQRYILACRISTRKSVENNLKFHFFWWRIKINSWNVSQFLTDSWHNSIVFSFFCQNRILIKTILLTKYMGILYQLTGILNLKIICNVIDQFIYTDQFYIRLHQSIVNSLRGAKRTYHQQFLAVWRIEDANQLWIP